MDLVLSSPEAFILRDNGRLIASGQSRVWRDGSGEEEHPQAGEQTVSVVFTLSPLQERLWQVHFSVQNTAPFSQTIHRVRLEVVLPAEAWQAGEGQLWSLQGAAVKWGQDFAFPLPIGFQRENYLGHLQDGEGGGVPLVYCWNREQGIALMALSEQPLEWWMPVEQDAEKTVMAFEMRRPLVLSPGQVWRSPMFAIGGYLATDFFAPLADYRRRMQTHHPVPPPPPSAYQPAWCSWGYEFDVHPQDLLDVLPQALDLGLGWFTLDDRWFDTYGDWNPRAELFPHGAEDMRSLNQAIHQAGGFSQLWWYPLCAEDGHGAWESHDYTLSALLRRHPDWVVIDEHGQVARNNRHLAMLCPALPEVQEYTLTLVRRFLEEWGFDGFKLDNIYTMPACHNPLHHHASPQDSINAFGDLYRQIFELSRRIRPHSVVQICPCGTPITFSLLPATNQTVTADPVSSAQVRQRIKFYKALHGPRAAVFADHVELSDGGMDFASAIGTGGVPSTKFTASHSSAHHAKHKQNWELSPEKFETWRFWFDLYARYRLAEGEYLNLYDLAFDYPEGHCIRKDGKRYFAFFAPHFEGEVELRGLEDRAYHVLDYEKERDLGRVRGPRSRLAVRFEHHCLLEAVPSD